MIPSGSKMYLILPSSNREEFSNVQKLFRHSQREDGASE